MSLARQIERIKKEIADIDVAIDILNSPGEAWDESIHNQGPIRILEEARRKLKAKL